MARTRERKGRRPAMLDELAKCCVSETLRLVDAMRVLEVSSVEIALVTDSEEHLVGTLTDGDIRRALLAGASLESPLAPYMQRQFTSVSAATERVEVLDLMRALTISQIPVVDFGGKLIGLHLMRRVRRQPGADNWAVVMAGGRGTRLARPPKRCRSRCCASRAARSSSASCSISSGAACGGSSPSTTSVTSSTSTSATASASVPHRVPPRRSPLGTGGVGAASRSAAARRWSS